MPLMPPAPAPPPAYALDIKVNVESYLDNPDPSGNAMCTEATGNPENSNVADAEYYKSMVSISGDVMVAGSPWEKITEDCDAGAAYVYAREASADGTSYSWTHIQKITATDASKWDHDPEDSSDTRNHPTKNFGHAVAVDGDTMVISYQFGRNVRVYTRSDAGNPKSLWTLRAKLAVPSLTHDDTTPDTWSEGYGFAVAIDGDTIVVGQPGAHAETDSDADRRKLRGAAHVFTRDQAGDLTSSWRYVSRLSTDTFNDQSFVIEELFFGQSVAIDGDVIIVGTSDAEGGSQTVDCTGVHVFARVTPGDLASEFKWIQILDAEWGNTEETKKCEPSFGTRGMAIEGGTMIIGAQNEDDTRVREGCGGDQGASYVFERISPGSYDSNWTLVQKITSPYMSCNQSPKFGAVIALSHDALVISEPGAAWEWDYPSETEADASAHHLGAGAVHVYTRGQDSTAPNASWWTLKATVGQGGLDAPNRANREGDSNSAGLYFGVGVAIDEDRLAVTTMGATHFRSVFSVDGVPTSWIVVPPPDGPWINTLFRDSFTTAMSLVVLMGLGPSAAFAVMAIFFKPALRKFLIKHGMKKIADKIVPDLADDFRLMKVEMKEMQNFFAEQIAFPRLKLGIDVQPEIAADDIKLEPTKAATDPLKKSTASFGTVCKATVRGETCDVNTVLPGAGAVGVPDDVAKTIQKEINVISTFNHPNLVKVKGSCAEKGQIVMEHCEGGSLGGKLSQEEDGMSKWQRAKIASQTAAAAAYLHKQGMAHGELSTDSIQLTNNNEAKLGEYGMKQTKKKVNKLTAAMFVVGAGIARVAATTLEIAEAVMESYDPEAARGFEERRRRIVAAAGRTNKVQPERVTGFTPNPGPVCESNEDGDDDDDEKTEAEAMAKANRAAMTAPELLKKGGGGFGSEPSATPAADVYSLGMTLWMMYEKRRPYGQARAHEIRARVLAGERPDFESDIKFELKGLIECCLKENPKERPPAVKVALLMKKIGETESKLQEGDAKVKHEKKFRAF